jgi:restriction system protein
MTAYLHSLVDRTLIAPGPVTGGPVRPELHFHLLTSAIRLMAGSLRRSGELLRTLFQVLQQHPDGIAASEAIRGVEARVKLAPDEEGNYSNGARRFDKIVRFATIKCVKAGWLVKERGRWFLTDAGIEAFRRHTDPDDFVRKADELYKEWHKAQPDRVVEEEVGDPELRASAGVTFEEASEQAWTEIERHLTTLPPYEFQDLVAALLRGMGYHVGWVAPPGKDGGVDVIAFNDPLGSRPPRIKVQVKRQQQRVTVDGLRSFMALLGAEDVGIFVNAGGFTKDAEDEARTQQVRRVTLVDLERLVDLWKEHYDKLDETARRRLPLQPIHFLAPES